MIAVRAAKPLTSDDAFALVLTYARCVLDVHGIDRLLLPNLYAFAFPGSDRAKHLPGGIQHCECDRLVQLGHQRYRVGRRLYQKRFAARFPRSNFLVLGANVWTAQRQLLRGDQLRCLGGGMPASNAYAAAGSPTEVAET